MEHFQHFGDIVVKLMDTAKKPLTILQRLSETLSTQDHCWKKQ